MGLEESTRSTIHTITKKWLYRDTIFANSDDEITAEIEAAMLFLIDSISNDHIYSLLKSQTKEAVVGFLEETLREPKPDDFKAYFDRQRLNTLLVQPLVDEKYEMVTPDNAYDIGYLSIFCDVIWAAVTNDFQREVISVLSKLK